MMTTPKRIMQVDISRVLGVSHPTLGLGVERVGERIRRTLVSGNRKFFSVVQAPFGVAHLGDATSAIFSTPNQKTKASS